MSRTRRHDRRVGLRLGAESDGGTDPECRLDGGGPDVVVLPVEVVSYAASEEGAVRPGPPEGGGRTAPALGPRCYYYAVGTPGSVRVAIRWENLSAGGSRSRRGPITGFSADSRRRLLQRAVSLPWEEAVGPGGLGMVTLTYPGVYPTEGPAVKAQLDRLHRRWRRRYGPVKGMWKLEFQERGAPHFHCFVGLAEEEEALRAWLLRAWYECVGSGDKRHLYNGVDISRWRWGSLGENRAKVGEYFARHGAKGWQSYQNEVPEGFTSPGNFWGYWGRAEGFRPIEDLTLVDRETYMQLRRLVWTLQEKTRGQKPRKGGGHKGAYSLSVDGIRTGRRWVQALTTEARNQANTSSGAG